MAFEIALIPEVDLAPQGSTDSLVRAAQTALAHERVQGAELAILLSNDEKLAALNQTYRGYDEPTDVLAFPAGGDPELPEETSYLGDIAISVARAAEQAAEAGHGLMDELQLLVIHGTLHLLGHDHGEPDERDRMWAAQRAILETLGLPASLSE
jgi:probable rRNA maturation factor